MSTSDSDSDFPFSVGQQKSEIAYNLNTTVLQVFLMGLYTMVYAGTMYIYVSRKAANRRFIVSATTLLYILCLAVVLVNWYYLYLDFVTEGDTRESIFISTVSGPQWLFNLFVSLSFAVYVVADGILLWRCYHSWGKSLRVVAFPLLLYLAEIGLYITVVTLSALIPQFEDRSNSSLLTIANNVLSAQVFMSAGTTIVTSFLIGYRIHTASNGSRFNKPFKHIVELVAESSAAYSVALLFFAIVNVTPSLTHVGLPGDLAQYLGQVIAVIVAGLAPTILVARIALSNPNNIVAPTITHISGLQFKSSPGGDQNTTAGDFNQSTELRESAQDLEEKHSTGEIGGEHSV